MASKFSKIFAAILSLTVILSMLSSCSSERKQEKQLFAMDTIMTLTAYGADTESALGRAAEKIKSLDSILSAQSQSSEISAINSACGAETAASDDVIIPLKAALDVFEKSGGALDITVYPIIKAWGFISKDYRVPSAGEMNALLKKTGSGAISVSENTVTVPDGYEIDLGSVAKGYASQCAIDTLRSCGVKSSIISLGGNVQTLGAPPDRDLWGIAIANPDDSGDSSIGTLNVGECAVVTSGGYQRYFESEGKIYHHIINPETGYPADSGLSSVTVVCENGTYADALSTALFVMGLNRSLEYYEKNGGFEAIFLTDDGHVTVTDGLIDCFTLNGDCGYSYEK